MKKLSAALTAALLLGTASSLLADQATLVNGDHISGRIVSLDKGLLTMQTEAMGEIKLRFDKLAELSADAPLAVNVNGSEVSSQHLRFAPEGVQIEIASKPVMTATREQILAMIQAPTITPQTIRTPQDPARLVPAWRRGWTSSIDASYSSARSDARSTSYSTAVRAQRVTSSTRLTLGYQTLYSKSVDSSGTISTGSDSAHSGARYELNVSDSTFTFAFSSFDQDKVQKLDLRQVYGAGAGFRLRQSANMHMDVFSGLSMNREDYAASASTAGRESGELLFGEDSSGTLFNRLTLNSRLSLYPNFTMPGDIRAVVDAGASTKLNQWLSWQFTVSDSYTSRPVSTTHPNSLAISTGLRVQLGRSKDFKPRTSELKFYRNGNY